MVRVVGEWEEQAAVWLAFPHNDNWQGISFDKTKFKSGLEAIQDFYFRLIDICLDYQDVKLIFNDEALMMSVIGKLASFSNKKFKLNSFINSIGHKIICFINIEYFA